MRKLSLSHFGIHILLISLTLMATGAPAFAQRFEAATALTIGTRAQKVFVADFNKDGKPDLLVIDNPGGGLATANLQVLLGNGDGTFQAPISTPSITDFSVAAIGDFNGDGVTDVAMVALNAGTLTIFLGNGDGTFAATAQGPLKTGNNPSFIKAVDLNGDGNLDLLVANSGDNTLSTFTGKGDGTFTLAGTQTFSSGNIDSLLGLAIGDFDGDGNPDVVLTVDSPNSFSVLKGNGDGTLQSPVSIPLTMAGAIIPGIIAAVDFDGDGKLDLVFVGFTGVLLFRGNGNLTFQPPVALSGDFAIGQIEIADMNGDGHPDLVVIDSGGIRLLFNDGSGGILPSQLYSAFPSSTLAVADLNGDGHPDVVVGNFSLVSTAGPNNIQIILNNGDGTMHDGFGLGFGQGAVVADFNHDGRPDIGIGTPREQGALLNSGNFQFSSAGLFLGNAGTSLDMVAADLNGDGNQDLVAVGDTARGFLPAGMVVQLGNGDGTFKPAAMQPPPLPAPAALHRIVSGDFNGDGKVDVVVTNMDTGTPPTTVGVFLGNGDGTFQAPSIITAGSSLTGITAGAFTTSGHLDIAVANKGDGTNPSTVSILLGKGDGTFTLGTPVNVGVAPVAVAAGDLDGDGKLDLVVANGGSGSGGTVSIFLGKGDGTFQSPVTLSLASAGVAVTLGDFNGDGFLDIAVAEHGSMIALFINNGDGTFPAVPERYATGGDPDFLLAVDLNNGGLPDLLTSGNLNVLPNRGGTRIALKSSQNPSGAGHAVTFSATVLANVPGTTQPTGTVQFFDGGSSLGSVSLSANGTATVTTSSLTGGNHTITAKYSGDANHPARNLPNLVQSVLGNTSVQVTSSANPSVFGSPLTIGVSVTSTTTGTPTGSVSLLDGSTVIASTTLDGSGKASFTPSLTGGTHSLTVSYAGDENFVASVSNPALSQVVNTAPTSPSLKSSANPSTFGSAVTFTVHVTGVNSIAPTGTVSLVDGATTVTSTTLDNSGNATFNVGNFGAGTHNLTASYAGDQNFSASISTDLQQVVNQAATSPTISSNFNPVTYSTNFAITVKVIGPNGTIPTGTVSLLDGGATLTSGTLDGSGNITFAIAGFGQPGEGLGVGTHNFTASYAGDQNFSTSVSPILQQVITKATPFLSVGISPNPDIDAQFVIVNVGLSPSAGGVPGTLSLLDGSTLIASGNADASGFFKFTLSTLGLGQHSISASYPGDANRNPATTPATSLNVFPLDFSISASTASSTVNAGQSAMATLTIFANPSFTTPVSFNCSGLPALASCSFSPPTINPNATFQSVTLTVMTTGPSAALSSPARGSSHAPLYALVLPGLAGLLLLANQRRRLPKRTTVYCLLLLGLTLLSSCGGGGGTGPKPITQTPDGTSTVVITANGGVAHQVTLTLTVKN